ncbi:hypothetical protein [Hydrogenophaga sp.]|uniref:hypothetical protein n=1 Tax=Hydrogenophaga sp. TaxID=1904254 RepID=UPI003F6F4145
MSAIPEIQSIRDSDTLSGLLATQERQDEAEAETRANFMRAVEVGNAGNFQPWAGLVTDYEACRRLHINLNDPLRPKRTQALFEIMAEALDVGDGPGYSDLMQMLLSGMKCSDPMHALLCRQLATRMATVWASHYTQGVDE